MADSVGLTPPASLPTNPEHTTPKTHPHATHRASSVSTTTVDWTSDTPPSVMHQLESSSVFLVIQGIIYGMTSTITIIIQSSAAAPANSDTANKQIRRINGKHNNAISLLALPRGAPHHESDQSRRSISVISADQRVANPRPPRTSTRTTAPTGVTVLYRRGTSLPPASQAPAAPTGVHPAAPTGTTALLEDSRRSCSSFLRTEIVRHKKVSSTTASML